LFAACPAGSTRSLCCQQSGISRSEPDRPDHSVGVLRRHRSVERAQQDIGIKTPLPASTNNSNTAITGARSEPAGLVVGKPRAIIDRCGRSDGREICGRLD
jgi:hypothetical protein